MNHLLSCNQLHAISSTYIVYNVVPLLFHDTQLVCMKAAFRELVAATQFQYGSGSSGHEGAAEDAAGIGHRSHPSWVKRRAIKLKRGVHIWLLLISMGQ